MYIYNANHIIQILVIFFIL